jgi:putative N6-adenine-specific DNA methylase
MRLASFPATDADALRRGLSAFHPRDLLGGQSLALSASIMRSQLSRVDRLIETAAKAWRVTPAKEEGAQSVLLRLDGDVCTVSVDTSGELLYRRGYRQEVSRAPMRETLAAGLLISAGWRPEEPLWDPLCGSGTLPIEAALMSLRRAPGLGRTFACEGWRGVNGAEAQSLRERIAAEASAKAPAPIWATDVHAGSLGTARRNARRAGVLEALKLERQDVTKLTLTPPAETGLVIANLPYGIRVGEKRELETLYRGLSRTLREKLPGWRVALYVAKDSPVQALEVHVKKRLAIPNGGIRCELLLGAVG